MGVLVLPGEIGFWFCRREAVMKKTNVLVAATSFVALAAMVSAAPALAELSIPNLQGTWECTVYSETRDWEGEVTQEEIQDTVYIYQVPYVPNEPNLTVVISSDPDDPFQGFVQGKTFSFYKNNQHGEPNLGREIMVGKVKKRGTKLVGKGVGFDSNPGWGGTWWYKFEAVKTSDDVP